MSVSEFFTYYIKVPRFRKELKEPCVKMRIKFCALLGIFTIFLGFTFMKLQRRSFVIMELTGPDGNSGIPWNGRIPFWADSAPYLVEPLDTNVLRYQTISLGCFQMYSDYEYGVYIAVGVGSECPLICSQKGMIYYLPMRNGDCLCTSDPSNLVKVFSWRECNQACSGSYCDENELFKITEKYEIGVSQSSLARSLVSCLKFPVEHPESPSTVFKIANLTYAQCVVHCESGNFTLALVNKQEDVCMCSHSHLLFKDASEMKSLLVDCATNSSDVMPLFQTYTIDPYCHSRRFLASNEFPSTALRSYPGSGSIYLRYFLETTTGIYTGSVYSDKELFRMGLLGEILSPMSGRTVVTEDHFTGNRSAQFYDYSLILIRNPYDVIKMNFPSIEEGYTGHSEFNQTEIEALLRVNRTAVEWRHVLKSYFDTNSVAIVVYFEDLTSDIITEMRRIIDFLPQKNINSFALERRLMCLNLETYKRFRLPRTKLDFGFLNSEVRSIVNANVKIVSELMMKMGYGLLPECYYNY